MPRILGQDRALNQLRSSIRSGKVHHAWIFHGPFGVGKFTAAVEFAGLLLRESLADEEIERFEADPLARSTELLRGGSHPDLHIINREKSLDSDDVKIRNQKQTNIPVGVVRQFIIGGMVGERFFEGPAYLTATMGQSKVFILDEAEYLDDTSQNALLKTLEEPPLRTYLILIATQEQWLLPTIRSRCQRVGFGTLPADAMGQWLEQACPELKGETRRWIERFSRGAPGIAQSALEHGFAEAYGAMKPSLDQLQAGGFPAGLADEWSRFMADYADAIVKKNEQASKDAANKDATGWLLRLAAMHAGETLAQSAESGDVSGAKRAVRVVELLQETERLINANVNAKLVLAHTVAQWHVIARAGMAMRPVA